MFPFCYFFNDGDTYAKESPGLALAKTGHRPGNDLLSQGLSPHYHRRNSVSLPGSGWDRVVPPCYGHQNPEEVCSDYCVVISVLLRQTSDDKQLSVCSEWLSFVLSGSWERAEFVFRTDH